MLFRSEGAYRVSDGLRPTASVRGDGGLLFAFASERLGGDFAAALVRFERSGAGELREIFRLALEQTVPDDEHVGHGDAGGEQEHEELGELNHTVTFVRAAIRRPQFMSVN